MKFILILVALICVLIVAITFGSGNDQLVTFNYLIAQSQVRLSSLVATTFGIGFLLSWILCGIYLFRMRFKIGQLQRQVKKLEAKQTQADQALRQKTLEEV